MLRNKVIDLSNEDIRMLVLIGLLACVQEKEEVVEAYSLSSEMLDYGTIPIDTWQEQAFSFQNLGSDSMQILSIGIIDASETVWTVDREEINELPSGDYLTVTVRFEPVDEEPSIARVQIRTDMTETPILYVEALGQGSPSILDEDGDGFSPADGDCNDNNASIFPNAEEVCDGKDSNCDGILPEDEEDIDSDGWAACDGDCDDYDADVYPNAPEICDDLDNDCDGYIPDLEDLDGDGQTACDGDCDDNNPDRWWGNEEVCDYIDNSCSGVVDDLDEDGDGHSACPSGGDCNDRLATAYPVVFDSAAADGGDGSPSRPFNNIDSAIQNLDTICRTVMVKPGSHTVSAGWNGGLLRISGASRYADEVVLTPEGPDLAIFAIYSNSELVLDGLTLFEGSGGGYGGAIYADQATVRILNSILLSNSSGLSGGAIAVEDYSTLEIINSDLSYNDAGGGGGAIYTERSFVSISDSTLSHNNATQGAGIESIQSFYTITNTTFSNNSASGEGGAIGLYSGSRLSMTRGDFIENQAAYSGGGIIIRDTNQPVVIRNGIFHSNAVGESGGAIAVLGSDSSTMIANNTFVDNVAIEEGGDLYSSPETSSEGVWFWGNITAYADAMSSVFISDESNAQVAFNSCFEPFSNVTQQSDCFVIPSGADVGFNTNQDPLFSSFSNDAIPWNDDLSLQQLSPAINAGPLPGTGASFYNSWTDSDGSRNDQGHLGGPEGIR